MPHLCSISMLLLVQLFYDTVWHCNFSIYFNFLRLGTDMSVRSVSSYSELGNFNQLGNSSSNSSDGSQSFGSFVKTYKPDMSDISWNVADQQASEAGYPPIADGVELPPPDQYVDFQKVGDDEIRFTYKNADGEEVKASVFKHNSPVRFAEVAFVMNAKEKGFEIVTDPNDLPPNPYEIGPFFSREQFITDTNGKAIGLSYYEDGKLRNIVVHEDLGKEAYNEIAEVWDFKQHCVDAYENGGYEVFEDMDGIPSYAQYTKFSEPGDAISYGGGAIAFEYVDEDGVAKKGIIYKKLDEEAFNYVKSSRDTMNQVEDFRERRNQYLEDKYRGSGIAARDVNIASRSWTLPPADVISVEDVTGKLGTTPDGEQVHGVVVTAYLSDDPDRVTGRYLILKDRAPEAYDEAMHIKKSSD